MIAISYGKISASEILDNMEAEIEELNNFDYYFRFKKQEELVPLIRKCLDEIDFRYTSYLSINTSVYWCGCLTLEPWCELDEGEEYILNELLHKNTEVAIDKDEIVVRFTMNPESFCHDLFLRYPDGYGGNIEYSYTSMLALVRRYLEAYINDAIPNMNDGWRCKWGEWYEVTVCPHCGETISVGYMDTRCPECKVSFYES